MRLSSSRLRCRRRGDRDVGGLEEAELRAQRRDWGEKGSLSLQAHRGWCHVTGMDEEGMTARARHVEQAEGAVRRIEQESWLGSCASAGKGQKRQKKRTSR